MPLSDSAELTGSLKTLLLRGLLAGLIAGLLAGTVGFFIGEPKINAAIAIEEAQSQPATDGHSHESTETGGHSHGDEEEPLVSRTGQKFGLFLALSLAGLALGAIYAVAANVARRYTTMSGTKLALGLAAGGWVAYTLVPFFKYPANPPAVGDPETITDRTWLWFASVLLGFAAVGVGVYVYKLLEKQLDTVRFIGGVAAFVLVVAIGYIALPGVNEVKSDFPATLLWEFRVSSLAQTATLWIALGLAFAALTEFATRDRAQALS
ncbi:CbtA family protein [Nocardia huaxiensis]|uniref:CbtA family protein n=1 Tax=Nocardia huaxiensis TaxID=2755382 RepID=A0A7D6ZJV2_9NOCA|nr:CbtA family protein [Nocardia huaxiensis]QLY31440.1 CbtA family protein [Nocardia huaxiensis]UFS94989.1 CbtA family protein [Nocardia huaxiensis]